MQMNDDFDTEGTGYKMDSRKHMMALYLAFVFWGSTIVMFKFALRTLPPVMLLFVRYLVAIPTLYIILRLRGALKRVRREDMPTIFLIGFMGYFFSFSLQMLSMDRLTGSIASLLSTLNPVFIPLLAVIFLRESLTAAKVISILISMTGVVIIVGVNGSADLAGVLLMLASVFLWSVTSIVMRRTRGRYDPMQVVMMGLICALPFVGVWGAAELRGASAEFPLLTVVSVVYLATFGMTVPHSLWNYCLSKMDASFCSMFYPLQTLISATLSVLLLGEKITASYVLGGVMICAGIVYAARSGMKKA